MELKGSSVCERGWDEVFGAGVVRALRTMGSILGVIEFKEERHMVRFTWVGERQSDLSRSHRQPEGSRPSAGPTLMYHSGHRTASSPLAQTPVHMHPDTTACLPPLVPVS